MALESLRDPLSRLSTLPVTMNVAFSPANSTNPYWSATTQYFQNDVVLSPVDDGAYVLLVTSTLLGGLDPSDPASDWYSLSKSTAGTAVVDSAVTATGGATTAYTLAGTPVLTLSAGSSWMVTVQANATAAAALDASDWLKWTVAVAGGSTASATFVPSVDTVAVSYSGAASFVVSAGSTAGAISFALIGGNAASTSLTLSGVVITCVRVV